MSSETIVEYGIDRGNWTTQHQLLTVDVQFSVNASTGVDVEEVINSPCATPASNELPLFAADNLSPLVAMRYYVYHIIMPTVFLVGIVGNTVSLVLSNRLRRGMSPVERSAAVGLIALAASDLLFCAIGVPELLTVYPTIGAVAVPDGDTWRVFGFYYELYRVPLYNVFLLTSTWIVVVVSAERCLAVSQPIKARLLTIRARRAAIIYVAVFVFSVVLCGPLFFKYRADVVNCAAGCRCMFSVVTEPFRSEATFRRVYHVVWLIVGHLVPLCALVVSGSVLIRVLYRRRVMLTTRTSVDGSTRDRRSGGLTATWTVVATVSLFFVLVCPSIVLESIQLIVGVDAMDGRQLDFYRIVVVLSNLAQSIRFACNFVFYVRLDKVLGRWRRRRNRTSGTVDASYWNDGSRLRGRRHVEDRLNYSPSYCTRSVFMNTMRVQSTVL